MGKLAAALFCLITISTKAQLVDTSINQQISFLAGNFSSFYVDNFRNIYLISESNQIKKVNVRFDSLGIYNDVRRFGDIASLDVDNPLKIAVFYKDFSTIIVLDRYLSFRNKIDLRKSGIAEATAFSQSFDNNYWVFDPVNNTVVKIDDNGRVLQRFNDFRLLFEFSFIPEKIIDRNNFVYLYDRSFGWLIFDYNGTLKQKIPFQNKRNVDVINGELAGRTDDNITVLNPTNFTEKTIQIPSHSSGLRDFYLDRYNLFVLDASGLFIYPAEK